MFSFLFNTIGIYKSSDDQVMNNSKAARDWLSSEALSENNRNNQSTCIKAAKLFKRHINNPDFSNNVARVALLKMRLYYVCLNSEVAALDILQSEYASQGSAYRNDNKFLSLSQIALIIYKHSKTNPDFTKQLTNVTDESSIKFMQALVDALNAYKNSAFIEDVIQKAKKNFVGNDSHSSIENNHQIKGTRFITVSASSNENTNPLDIVYYKMQGKDKASKIANIPLKEEMINLTANAEIKENMLNIFMQAQKNFIAVSCAKGVKPIAHYILTLEILKLYTTVFSSNDTEVCAEKIHELLKNNPDLVCSKEQFASAIRNAGVLYRYALERQLKDVLSQSDFDNLLSLNEPKPAQDESRSNVLRNIH